MAKEIKTLKEIIHIYEMELQSYKNLGLTERVNRTKEKINMVKGELIKLEVVPA